MKNDEPNKRILVTGAAGFIGSVLVRQLLDRGYVLRGFDNLLFGDESLLGIYSHKNFEFIKGDIRDEREVEAALDGVDSVVHLAAIVGGPACSKNHQLAEETNWIATKMLFDKCNEFNNLRRFVFASTCSNYGRIEGNGYVNEDSPLRPVSWYAELKVRFEQYALEKEIREDFVPCILRFSTAYGLSPRMRFDLTVNEFTRELTLGKELEVFGEQFWRPYCHVEDLARACVLALEADEEKVKGNVLGVGDTRENYQKKMIVEEILKIIPDGKVKYVHKDEDPRDYRVDFSKIKEQLGFEISRTVQESIAEVAQSVNGGVAEDFGNRPYCNAIRL